jgi:hypothetical protein
MDTGGNLVLLSFKLAGVEMVAKPAPVQQLLVRSLLDDLPAGMIL